MNDDSEDFTRDLTRSWEADAKIQYEEDFTTWCDQLTALPSDFEPELNDNIKAHIELQPLRWMNSGLDLMHRRKVSLFDSYLPYPIFRMGAEIFLKGMWLCQFEECRLLSDDSYISEKKRQYLATSLRIHSVTTSLKSPQDCDRY